jgi:uncharacterized protein YndB with AHSA1/START domain
MNTDDTLDLVNGRSVLRMRRRLRHPPDKVWRALTEPAHLAKWFPATVELTLSPDAKITFVQQEGPPTHGVVTELDPQRVFEFSWGDDVLRWELEPDDADHGGCLLTLTHTFDDRAGAASFASGWHTCIQALDASLAGRSLRLPTTMAEMARLHESRIAHFGLDHGHLDGHTIRFERQLTQPVPVVWPMLTTTFATADAVLDPPHLLEHGDVRWELRDGTGHGARLVLTHRNAPDGALDTWRDDIEALAASVASAADRGDLRSSGGRTRLRFERRLPHPVAKVWRALTEPEHLRTWFPAVVDFDLTPGAELVFAPTPEQQRRLGIPADQLTHGTLTAAEPPTLLEYTWSGDLLRWELIPEGGSACTLVFTTTFPADDTRGTAAGWHTALDTLESHLDARPLLDPWQRAAHLEPIYAADQT